MKNIVVTTILLFLSASPLPANTDSERCEPNLSLKIINAEYGADEKWIKVTNQLTKEIRDNCLAIKVSNNIAGDPYPYKAKQLKVEYMLDGEYKKIAVPEEQWLYIPFDVSRHPESKSAETEEELMILVKKCPAEVGFYGRNLSTGQTVEYRPDQPACLASIVKIFVLLEVMRQADQNSLDLSESITIVRKGRDEVCSISQALDKMIGISDNEATDALAARVDYTGVNALPDELGIRGLSKTILPKPGILAKVLDKRIYSDKLLAEELLPQHGTARGIVRYFELLNQKKLINERISTKVLEVFDKNPMTFALTAAPADFNCVGKGGSIGWARLFAKPYNMLGWGALVRSRDTAIAFCVWFERFPENTSEDLKLKWCQTLSDSIVNILLAPQRTDNKTGVKEN